MRLAVAALAAWGALGLGAANAQERLTPSEFLDRAERNTFTFRSFPDGRLVGVEQFLSRDRSVWARDDGRCTYGQITVEGPTVCFRYEDDPNVKHCWVPFTVDDKLIVRAANGEVQEISNISQRPVQCTDALLS